MGMLFRKFDAVFASCLFRVRIQLGKAECVGASFCSMLNPVDFVAGPTPTSTAFQVHSGPRRYFDRWVRDDMLALRRGITFALIILVVHVATEARGDPSKYYSDPIPYCLSYIAHNESCDRESKDTAWICREAVRDLTQPSCIKWDEASILKFCRGWTDNSSLFGEQPASKFCNGPCWISYGFPPGFRCLNPK